METESLTQTIEGGYLVPSKDSHLGAWQLQCGKLDHDEFLPPLVCSHLKRRDFVIDAGAFNGDHSIAYSRILGPDGMIISVEGGSLAFSMLKHNVSLFPDHNTYALQACVSDKDGDIIGHSTNDNLGASICNQIIDPKEGEKYIRSVTIDFLVIQAQRPLNFLKLDIEGWECKALLGASRTLKNDRPKMLIECNPAALERQGDSLEDVLAILAYHEYDWEIVQPECQLSDPQFDILCKPRERLLQKVTD